MSSRAFYSLGSIPSPSGRISYYDYVIGTPGLISYYRMNAADNAASGPIDKTGYQNGSWLGSGRSVIAGLIAGDPDGAIRLTGDYAGFGNPTNFQILNGTLKAWIKHDGDLGYRAIISKGVDYGIWLHDQILVAWDHVVGDHSSGVNLNDGFKHQVAFTFQDGVSNGSQLYVDGQPAGASFTYAVQNLNVDLHIADNPSAEGTQKWLGTLDEPAIYSSVLTPAQILQDYNIGMGG